MAYYSIPLKAGVPHLQEIPGALILVDGVDGAAGVDITPITSGSRQVTMPARKAGFKYRVQFDSVELVAAADCQVRIFLTTNDVTLGFTDGAQVNVVGSVLVSNGDDNRVPVDLASGSVTVTASDVGINNKLTVLTHFPVANVGTVAASVVNDVTQKRLRFRNTHATAVIALGAAGVTVANAAILLNPGDVWTEDDAPGANWSAISDTANASLAIMGMK